MTALSSITLLFVILHVTPWQAVLLLCSCALCLACWLAAMAWQLTASQCIGCLHRLGSHVHTQCSVHPKLRLLAPSCSCAYWHPHDGGAAGGTHACAAPGRRHLSRAAGGTLQGSSHATGPAAPAPAGPSQRPAAWPLPSAAAIPRPARARHAPRAHARPLHASPWPPGLPPRAHGYAPRCWHAALPASWPPSRHARHAGWHAQAAASWLQPCASSAHDGPAAWLHAWQAPLRAHGRTYGYGPAAATRCATSCCALSLWPCCSPASPSCHDEPACRCIHWLCRTASSSAVPTPAVWCLSQSLTPVPAFHASQAQCTRDPP